MRELIKILMISLALVFAAGLASASAQLIAVDDSKDNAADGDSAALGSAYLLDLEATPDEAERFKNSLDLILEAYREREFGEMQQLLNTLFMYEPDARKWELPRLLEAEAYYFNGSADLGMRTRHAKPIYQELMSLFPKSGRNSQKLFRIASIMRQQTFYPEAEGRFAYLIEAYPGSGLVQKSKLALGKIDLAMENPEKAFEQFESVYDYVGSTKAEKFSAVAGMAVAKMDSGFFADAARYFADIISGPEDMSRLDEKTLFSYGDLQRVTGNVASAKSAFLELLQKNPETIYKPEVWYRLGEFALAEGDEDKAVVLFSKTTEDFPKSQWGYESELRLGLILAKKHRGQWSEEAAAYLDDVVRNLLFPELSQDAQLALAEMMIDAERNDQALAVLESLLVRSISDERLLRGLDMIAEAFENFVQREFEDSNYIAICLAYKNYAQFVINERMKSSVFDRITESFYQSLLFDSLYTIGVSREAIRLFPNRAELARARADEARGNYREAGIVFRELVRRDKGYVGGKAALLNARMQDKQDNPVVAIEMADSALRIAQTKTDKAELFVLRSRSKLKLGEAVAAVEGFRRAVDLLLPAEKERERVVLADALYGLAASMYRSGRHDSAEPVIEAALGAFPEDVRSGLAKVYLSAIREKADPHIETSAWWNEIAGLMATNDAWLSATKDRGAWDDY